LHPRQVNRVRDESSLTLNLSLTLRARAACSFASLGSVCESSTADSVRSLTTEDASCLGCLRRVIGAGPGWKGLIMLSL